jgi:hypothetical protein
VSELPTERPVEPRPDDHAGDLDTLVDMGVIPAGPSEPEPVAPTVP